MCFTERRTVRFIQFLKNACAGESISESSYLRIKLVDEAFEYLGKSEGYPGITAADDGRSFTCSHDEVMAIVRPYQRILLKIHDILAVAGRVDFTDADDDMPLFLIVSVGVYDVKREMVIGKVKESNFFECT